MNKLNRTISYLISYGIIVLVCSCATPVKRSTDKPSLELTKSGISSPKENKLIVLNHSVFKVHYDPSIRLARIVSYRLTKNDLKPTSVKRRNKFIADPILVSQALPHVVPDEYKKTGYDQGHLAPSGDFIKTQAENDLTFVMSNMAPQLPRLNRDSWRLLELKVRGWACGEQTIDVYTGPILGTSKKKLPAGLVIPEKFFKIVVDQTPPKKIAAFIYDQKDSKATAAEQLVSLHEVEASAGIKIIPKSERSYQSSIHLNDWHEDKCYKPIK